jgi:hypothetical protein
MKLRISLPIVALPLAALALAGCGGGGGGDSTATSTPVTTAPPQLSKQELISQGDGICAEVNAAVGTLAASEAEASDKVTQEADLYTGMVERLKGLGEPEEDTGYAEFIASADELSQAESNARLASERGEEGGLESAESEAASALSAFQSAAGAYGFEKCSEEPSAPAATEPGGTASETEEEAPAEAVEEVAPEEAPEEVAPETGGAGGGPEGGGTGAGESAPEGGGGSGGIGPG